MVAANKFSRRIASHTYVSILFLPNIFFFHKFVQLNNINHFFHNHFQEIFLQLGFINKIKDLNKIFLFWASITNIYLYLFIINKSLR